VRSSNRQYLAGVDHLRAYAAILIVLYHSLQLISPRIIGLNQTVVWTYSNDPLVTLVAEGHTAVTLFMVLSGFIFTVGTLGHGVSFPRFMGNRLLRIYPLFLLLIILGVAFSPGSFTSGGFFLTVLGLGNYPGGMSLGAISAMFWAVAIEMQFYLMFPLLNRILNKSGVLTLVRLLAAVILVRGMAWVYDGTATRSVQASLYYNLAGRIDDFLIGMIAAWFFVHHRAWFRGWWKVALSLGVVLATMWEFNRANGLQSNALWRLPWIDWEAGMWAMVILTYVATLRSHNIVSRSIAKIGEMSFSIYLLHFTLLQLVMRKHLYIRIEGLTGRQNAFLTSVLVLLPIVVVCSWFTYNGVEKPFLSLRMRYLKPLDEPAAAEPAADDASYRPRHEPPAETVVSEPPGSMPVPVQGNGRGKAPAEPLNNESLSALD
jgi:peptidoglycan/LPS O-acetylase OafA/YrhL